MNPEYIRHNMENIAAIGADPEGGISRVFGSSYMKECEQRTLEYFQECGMEAWIDSVGNVHGVLKAENDDEKEILIGSHIDTVKQGGIFDGLLGVIAGAEVAREMKKNSDVFKKSIHVIATNGEEGNELGGTFGSRAMMGLLQLDSKNYIELAGRYGYSKEDLKNAVMDVSKAECYLELHIEQGPTLYNHREKIGIVTGIVGLRRYKVTVHGISNHAGTTMMEDRDDALVSAAKVILMADEMARNMGNQFVETIGIVKVYPGSAPTIPNRVEMVLEIRNQNELLMDEYIRKFKEQLRHVARADVEPMVIKPPVMCNEKIVNIIEEICKEEHLPYRVMPSGATHDGNAMATKMPVSMIFVPSKDGISHAKEEWTDWEDVYTGISVLYRLIKTLEEREEI